MIIEIALLCKLAFTGMCSVPGKVAKLSNGEVTISSLMGDPSIKQGRLGICAYAGYHQYYNIKTTHRLSKYCHSIYDIS